jgi:hypothetical protein
MELLAALSERAILATRTGEELLSLLLRILLNPVALAGAGWASHYDRCLGITHYRGLSSTV